MDNIFVRIWDITGSRSQQVEAPNDVAVGRLLVILVERMGLPLNSPDGQIMSYKLHHKRTGQQLLDNQTLSDAGVRSGDDLRLQPEITAGTPWRMSGATGRAAGLAADRPVRGRARALVGPKRPASGTPPVTIVTPVPWRPRPRKEEAHGRSC